MLREETIDSPVYNKKLHQTNIAAFVLCQSLRSILHKPFSAIFAGELGVSFTYLSVVFRGHWAMLNHHRSNLQALAHVEKMVSAGVFIAAWWLLNRFGIT